MFFVVVFFSCFSVKCFSFNSSVPDYANKRRALASTTQAKHYRIRVVVSSENNGLTVASDSY